MNSILSNLIKEAVISLFGNENSFPIEIQHTKENFEGDFTFVVFPLTKILKRKPDEIGKEIGAYLILNFSEINSFNVVGGFLNLSLSDDFLCKSIKNYSSQIPKKNQASLMVEYSSPNTNKPLHLGHIRNNLLGFATANILEATGYKVIKTQIINDRGIHICKSMVAWKNFSDGETPETTGTKGDHFVGKYYVKFDTEYRKQIKALEEKGIETEQAKKEAPLIKEAQELLIKWEQGDAETLGLWQKMNGWVYAGFEKSYKRLGVAFDSVQYESKTYLLGKDIVTHGIEKNVFTKKEDHSVWCDLTQEGLDEKLVLRKDGTSVYITQDLGTAIERFEKHTLDKLIYVVGNEQDYHFLVLFKMLKKLGYDWAENLHHLSYAMVDLPDGKMKSREGTVVDADDLMQEMFDTAKKISLELGKLDNYSDEEKTELYETIGMGALKYYILKVDPKKNILFDPKASIDFQGNTGSFIQYTHARICSLLDKQKPEEFSSIELSTIEKRIIRQLTDYSSVVYKSAESLNPSLISNFIYDLVKLFNSFYQSLPILKAEDTEVQNFRLFLSKQVAETIAHGMKLLGIDVPRRM